MENEMKILIDAFGIVNETTGVGQYSLQLINALSKMKDKNDYYICLRKDLDVKHPIFKLSSKKNIFFVAH